MALKKLHKLDHNNYQNKYPEMLRHVNRNSWFAASVKRDDIGIKIQGRYVMEKWQKDYMREFTKSIASLVKDRGDWLEVGYGLGLFAKASEALSVRKLIRNHYIIEPNHDIYEDLLTFANQVAKKSSAHHKIVPVRGMWQDVIENRDIFPNDNFEAIFFDGSPFDMKELIERQFDFGEHTLRLLKRGGVYSYCNLTGFGKQRSQYLSWREFFKKTQYKKLRKLGYVDI